MYKGSQWISPHRNIVHNLIGRLNIIYNNEEAILNDTISIIKMAPVEFIFIHSIINNIYKRNAKKYTNIVKNNLRFNRWNCEVKHCPNYLDEFNVSGNK